MFNKMTYAVLALLVLLASYGIFVKHNWLVLSTTQEKVVFVGLLPQEKEFFIRFTHSVALTPVDEFFVAHANQIVLKRTIYHDFGAGLPHMAETGQNMIFENGKIIISGFSLRIPTLHVRVGRIAKHTLYMPRLFADSFHSIRLDKFVNPGEAIAFNVEHISFLHAYLLGIRTIYWGW